MYGGSYNKSKLERMRNARYEWDGVDRDEVSLSAVGPSSILTAESKMGISERRLGELAAAGIIGCILNDLGPEDDKRRSPARGRVDEFGDRGGDRGEVRPLKLKCCWSAEGDASDGAALGDGGVVEADSLSRNSTHIFEKDCNKICIILLVTALTRGGNDILQFHHLYQVL